MLMVQSSRLGQARCVCFQLVAACSNSKGSRLEMGGAAGNFSRLPLISRIVANRDGAILVPVRNSPIVCFVGVTAVSVCESVSDRNDENRGAKARMKGSE
jgi:hypothetical protein